MKLGPRVSHIHGISLSHALSKHEYSVLKAIFLNTILSVVISKNVLTKAILGSRKGTKVEVVCDP